MILVPEDSLVANELHLFVPGVPRPQGSMKAHVTPNGKIAMRYGSAVAEWRRTSPLPLFMRWSSATGLRSGALHPRLLASPAVGHFGTGKNAGRIKPSAPGWPAVPGDLDKFVRAVGTLSPMRGSGGTTPSSSPSGPSSGTQTTGSSSGLTSL